MRGKGQEEVFSIIDRKCQLANKIVSIQGPGRFNKMAELMGGISKDGYGIVPGTRMARQKGLKKATGACGLLNAYSGTQSGKSLGGKPAIRKNFFPKRPWQDI